MVVIKNIHAKQFIAGDHSRNTSNFHAGHDCKNCKNVCPRSLQEIEKLKGQIEYYKRLAMRNNELVYYLKNEVLKLPLTIDLPTVTE